MRLAKWEECCAIQTPALSFPSIMPLPDMLWRDIALAMFN